MDDRRLRQVLSYRKFTGPEPRILVLDTGYWVIRDVLDAAEDLGWKVSTVAAPQKGTARSAFMSDLLLTLARHQPDFVLTINHLAFDEEGVLAGVLDRYEIPTASWFVDHPLPIVGGSPGNATPHCQVFCFERTALPWLEAEGFSEPVYLPTASNSRYFHPDRIDPERVRDLACPLSFAGNSWWDKCRREASPWARKAARALCRDHRVDRRLVANGLMERLRGVHAPGSRGRYALAQVVMALASNGTRGRFARALQPLGLRIHGDSNWETMAPGIDLQDFLEYSTDLPALFMATTVNANVTAEQMPTAVNQRVWDVPASGGFLLTDRQEDAVEFFEDGVEICTYGDLEEAADLARFYLAHAGHREAIITRARAKVDAFHRYTHRIQELADSMKGRFA